MENKLVVSPSPHIHSGDTIEKNMYGVLIAMIPAFLVAVYVFRLDALLITALSVLFCVGFEYLITKFLLKKRVFYSLSTFLRTFLSGFWHWVRFSVLVW